MAARVLIADDMSATAAQILEATEGIEVDVRTGLTPDELREAIGAYDGLLVRSATKVRADIIAAADRLKVIGRAGIGVDNIDVAAATARGIVVMNAPYGNATTTAEHAVAMLMSVSRHIPQATASMRAGRWDKKKFKGREVTGKTVGIIGLGNIGRIVADRLLGLHTRVIAFDPFLTAEAARKLGVEKVDLDTLFETADYVTIHTPLNEHTRGLVDAAAFAKMKPTAYLVHCARGGIVDEQALADALEKGEIAGAALDVMVQEPPPADHPLLANDRVILTPHLGASTVEAQVAVATQIAEQAAAMLTTGTIKHALNTSAVSGDALKALGPWLSLASRLGSLAAQVHTGEVAGVEVVYHGGLCDMDTAPLTAAALVDVLAHKVQTPVNAVNARAVATERGISVRTTDAGDHPDFTNLVSLRLEGPDTNTQIDGSVFGKSNPKIVGVDGYPMEFVPTGHVLLVKNRDTPGIIGAIGTELGGAGVNISRMALSLHDPAGQALSAWSTDAPVDDGALAAIRTAAGVLAAMRLSL